MKKKFIVIVFLLGMIIFPKNIKALTINVYNADGSGCMTCDNTTCVSPGFKTCNAAKRVSIHDSTYRLQSGIQYDLYTSILLDIKKSSVCTNNNLGLRSDKYVGNFQGSAWNSQSSLWWDSVDDISVGSEGSCRYNWGAVQRFNNTLNSNGLTMDFYFADTADLRYIKVARFELQNVPTAGSDMSSVVNSVNNGANSINNNINSNTQNIINNNNANTDKINGTLTDDNVSDAENQATDFFNNFNNNDHGLTGIISAPLRLINSLASSSCTPLQFPLPFVEQNVVLPCLRPILTQYFPSFITLYQLITTGIIGYWVCVKVFQKVKEFKDPNTDKIEVFDL